MSDVKILVNGWIPAALVDNLSTAIEQLGGKVELVGNILTVTFPDPIVDAVAADLEALAVDRTNADSGSETEGEEGSVDLLLQESEAEEDDSDDGSDEATDLPQFPKKAESFDDDDDYLNSQDFAF